jgi:hypothetical protein
VLAAHLVRRQTEALERQVISGRSSLRAAVFLRATTTQAQQETVVQAAGQTAQTPEPSASHFHQCREKTAARG